MHKHIWFLVLRTVKLKIADGVAYRSGKSKNTFRNRTYFFVDLYKNCFRKLLIFLTKHKTYV